MNDNNPETTAPDLGRTATITFPNGFEAPDVADAWGLLYACNKGIQAHWNEQSNSLVISNLGDEDARLVNFISALLDNCNEFDTHDLELWIEAVRASDLDAESAANLWEYFNPGPINMRATLLRRKTVHKHNFLLANLFVSGFNSFCRGGSVSMGS